MAAFDSSPLLTVPLLLALVCGACTSGNPQPPGQTQPDEDAADTGLPDAQTDADAAEDTAPDAMDDNTLVVATWNIEWLTDSPPSDLRPRSDEDYARLAAYAQRLDADLVFVQEVDGAELAARVFDPDVYDFAFTGQDALTQEVGVVYKKGLELEKMPDVEALDVGNDRLRWGIDVRVEVFGQTVRFLGIHLKSGCFDYPLSPFDYTCNLLRLQLPVLEAWIDARATEGTPAIILGDFNRRLDKEDAFWKALDDNEPEGTDLTLVTQGYRSRCWDSRFPRYIDHFVLNAPAVPLMEPGSFSQLVFDDEDAPFEDALSDHCPLTITLVP